MRPSDAMEEEFSTLPLWTAEAVETLGAEYAVPAACRGSGTPEALRWLGRVTGLRAGVRLVDSGAGEGGPAELAARELDVSPVLVDPVAGGEHLPFADGTFDAAWSLGVLCTVPDKASVLTELRRVVRPDGAVGLLVFVRTVPELRDQPEGNDFPDDAELESLMEGACLRVVERAALADFPDPPPSWQERVDAVDRAIEKAHHGDERLVAAQDQQRAIGRLLEDGLVEGRLLAARAPRSSRR
jgi:SAM-dependent methyltransferase